MLTLNDFVQTEEPDSHWHTRWTWIGEDGLYAVIAQDTETFAYDVYFHDYGINANYVPTIEDALAEINNTISSFSKEAKRRFAMGIKKLSAKTCDWCGDTTNAYFVDDNGDVVCVNCSDEDYEAALESLDDYQGRNDYKASKSAKEVFTDGQYFDEGTRLYEADEYELYVSQNYLSPGYNWGVYAPNSDDAIETGEANTERECVEQANAVISKTAKKAYGNTYEFVDGLYLNVYESEWSDTLYEWKVTDMYGNFMASGGGSSEADCIEQAEKRFINKTARFLELGMTFVDDIKSYTVTNITDREVEFTDEFGNVFVYPKVNNGEFDDYWLADYTWLKYKG